MTDFMDTLGYELPEDARQEVEAEGFQYYRHPIGLYMGFIGKITPKYKDAEGNKCEQETAGAVLAHYMLALWITKSLGGLEHPTDEVIIHPETLALPNRPLAETYFGQFLTRVPADQWKFRKMFESWRIPEHEKYNIIRPAANNPANIVTSFASFPAYYGLPIKFHLTAKDPSKGRYIDGEISIMSYEKRLPMEKLKAFEEIVDAKVAAERVEREANRSNDDYQSAPAPQTDFDSMGGDEDDAVDNFLK